VGLPVTHWSAPLLGEHVRAQGIEISDRSVSRILHDADLQPHRQQMYLTSHDDEFRDKRDDVLRVYYESPQSEHIVCVDEKTGVQALERRYADLPMERGQPVRREFEYIRHGTLCWMGAFDVRRGKPFGFASHEHNSDTFIELLDLIDAVYPPGSGHIVMDNLSAHDTADVNEWFDEHPRWTRHFTPKHASWLNQIECWFSILGRQVLSRGSFTSTDDLAAKIDRYVAWYLATDHPFRWSYRPKSWPRR
jgi:transposase